MNCSWVGAGAETANLTLLVDGEEQTGEEVKMEEEGRGEIVFTLDWRARNLTVGQAVVVSCNGQAGLVFISFGKSVKVNLMSNWLQEGGMGFCFLSE